MSEQARFGPAGLADSYPVKSSTRRELPRLRPD